jgi:hypothetical protein
MVVRTDLLVSVVGSNSKRDARSCAYGTEGVWTRGEISSCQNKLNLKQLHAAYLKYVLHL